MCKFVRYVQFVVPCSTIAVLVSICVDRFYTIIYPLSFKVSRTGAKTNDSWKLDLGIGGSRGARPARAPPKGPNSFVLTYKIFKT